MNTQKEMNKDESKIETKKPKYNLKLIREVFIVIIGALVALAADDWQEERERDERDQQVLSMVLSEIKTNLDNIKSSGSYHEDMLKKLNESIDILSNEDRFVTPEGWQDTSEIPTLTAAFQLALLSGTLSRIDADLALIISTLYDEIESFDIQRTQIGLSTLQTGFRDGTRYFRLKRVGFFAEIEYKKKLQPLLEQAVSQMRSLQLEK